MMVERPLSSWLLHIVRDIRYSPAWDRNCRKALHDRRRETRILRGTTEKVKQAALDVPISASGTYHLVLDNRFSLFSKKTVTGNVDVTYERLQQ